MSHLRGCSGGVCMSSSVQLQTGISEAIIRETAEEHGLEGYELAGALRDVQTHLQDNKEAYLASSPKWSAEALLIVTTDFEHWSTVADDVQAAARWLEAARDAHHQQTERLEAESESATGLIISDR